MHISSTARKGGLSCSKTVPFFTPVAEVVVLFLARGVQLAFQLSDCRRVSRDDPIRLVLVHRGRRCAVAEHSVGRSLRRGKLLDLGVDRIAGVVI